MSKFLTLASAASRLGVDASTAGKYTRRGLIVQRATRHHPGRRIKLNSWLVYRGARLRRLTTAAAVRRFNAQRGPR